MSLFTLHALWPFLWIWAMAYRPERGWGFRQQPANAPVPAAAAELQDLRRRVAELENSLKDQAPKHAGRKKNQLKETTAETRAVKAGGE